MNTQPPAPGSGSGPVPGAASGPATEEGTDTGPETFSSPETLAALRARLGPVGIWTGALDVVPASRARALAAELDELGYGSLFLPEVAGRDPFVHLALLLDSTTRLVGATGIANIWARDAVAMTEATKALEEAFPGRLLVGLGVSHEHLVGGLRGHDYRRPLAAMAAYLDGLDHSPYTAERPPTAPPRLLAALGPRMLALAGRRADGAHPYLVTPEHTALARSLLGPGPLLCVEQAAVETDDAAHARELGRAYVGVYAGLPNYANNLRRLGFDEDDLRPPYSDRLVDSLVAWGGGEAIAGRVRAHLDAGADHVCVQVLPEGRRAVPDAAWRRLAPALLQGTATGRGAR